jgi:hypothetical protein
MTSQRGWSVCTMAALAYRASVDGPADSLPALVDRLAAAVSTDHSVGVKKLSLGL